MDNLKAKFLMGMDVLGPEQVVIDIFNRKLRFGSCESIAVLCEVKARDKWWKRYESFTITCFGANI